MTQIHKFFQVTRVTLFTYIEEYFSGSHFLFLSIFCRFQIPASLLIGIYWAVINSNNINFCTCKKEKWFVSILHLLQDLYYHVSSLCLTANFHENFKKKKKVMILMFSARSERLELKQVCIKFFSIENWNTCFLPSPQNSSISKMPFDINVQDKIKVF